MMMKEKSRAASGHGPGPGGYRCACCDEPREGKKKIKRQVRATEKRAWKKEVSEWTR